MKKLLYVLLLLVVPALSNATDIPPIDLEIGLASDSSDSGVNYDTAYSDPFFTGKLGPDVSMSWEVYNIDSNWATDTLLIELQSANEYQASEAFKPSAWLKHAGNALKDTCVPASTNDTLEINNEVFAVDSLRDYARVMVVYRITVSGAIAQANAGESYGVTVRPIIRSRQ